MPNFSPRGNRTFKRFIEAEYDRRRHETVSRRDIALRQATEAFVPAKNSDKGRAQNKNVRDINEAITENMSQKLAGLRKQEDKINKLQRKLTLSKAKKDEDVLGVFGRLRHNRHKKQYAKLMESYQEEHAALSAHVKGIIENSEKNAGGKDPAVQASLNYHRAVSDYLRDAKIPAGARVNKEMHRDDVSGEIVEEQKLKKHDTLYDRTVGAVIYKRKEKEFLKELYQIEREDDYGNALYDDAFDDEFAYDESEYEKMEREEEKTVRRQMSAEKLGLRKETRAEPTKVKEKDAPQRERVMEK